MGKHDTFVIDGVHVGTDFITPSRNVGGRGYNEAGKIHFSHIILMGDNTVVSLSPTRRSVPSQPVVRILDASKMVNQDLQGLADVHVTNVVLFKFPQGGLLLVSLHT